MAKKKKVTKEQLENYIGKLKAYKEGQLQNYIDEVENTVKQMVLASLTATEPPNPPKNPPGI